MSNKTKQYIRADEQDESRKDKTALSDLKSLLWLLRFASKFKWKYIFALLLMVFAAILAVLSARITGEMIQEGFVEKKYTVAGICAGLIVLFELVGLLFQWQGRKILARYSSRTILNIRSALFSHLNLLPLSYYDHNPQGRVVTRITHDIEGIEEFFSSSMGRMIMSGLLCFVSIIAMLVTDFKIGIILTTTMIPLAFFIRFTKKLTRDASREMSRTSSAINTRLSEYIDGMEVIRSFGLEDWSNKNYQESVNSNLNASLKANFLFAWTRPLSSFFCSIPMMALIWFGGQMVFTGALGVGIFVTFVRYYQRFVDQVMMLTREIHVVQQAFTNAERVATFLKEKTENDLWGKLPHDDFQKLDGEIRFENLSMNYDNDEWVLNDLNFSISKGETVGFVGTTGCGKTTTVSLLARLYDFQRGDIFLDNRSIKEFNREFLRNQIGFVSQDVVIFKGTLRENLSLENSVSDQSILAACGKTGLFKIMKDSMLNLDSFILEGGSNLSVGERQILALTRVLLRNPAILILDEATANIDPEHEKIIQEAVNMIMHQRTCIIIAHRLDTLGACDRVVVFEDGRIVEQGGIGELIARKGRFHKLKDAEIGH